MAERREPGLDLDQLSNTVPTLDNPVSPALARGPAPKSGGGNLFLWLLVVALLGAVAALGYWGMQMRQSLQQQEVLVQQLNLWLESTDASLNAANNSASQSGETLRGRLDELTARVDDRVSHFDSEIAKLWTIAFQRNKPQLEAQAAQIEALTAQLSEQQRGVEQLVASLASLQTQTEDQRALSDEIQQSLVQQTEALATLETELGEGRSSVQEELAKLTSDTEFQFSVERDERAKLQARIDEALGRAEGRAATSAELSSRLTNLEETLAGIDASRRSLTSKLLELQAQMSALQ